MASRRSRVLAGMAMLPCLAGPGCAEQTLLCRRPEVLQEVGRQVRERNVYNEVERYSANEAPTSRANAVVCDAVMLSVGYEPTPAGWRAQPVRERLRYDVQVNGNRFFVQVMP